MCSSDLSRSHRLEAERRLKTGELKAVVATASLELGIDIGTVDLVCQIGSPRAISVALQRIGRAGHWVSAIPKGRIFATSRDELIESAAAELQMPDSIQGNFQGAAQMFKASLSNMPLLLLAAGFQTFYFTLLLWRMEAEIAGRKIRQLRLLSAQA